VLRISILVSDYFIGWCSLSWCQNVVFSALYGTWHYFGGSIQEDIEYHPLLWFMKWTLAIFLYLITLRKVMYSSWNKYTESVCWWTLSGYNFLVNSFWGTNILDNSIIQLQNLLPEQSISKWNLLLVFLVFAVNVFIVRCSLSGDENDILCHCRWHSMCLLWSSWKTPWFWISKQGNNCSISMGIFQLLGIWSWLCKCCYICSYRKHTQVICAFQCLFIRFLSA